MRSSLPSAGLVASLFVSTVLSIPSKYPSSAFSPNDIITRDVAIIGGGSSGTHAAISLKDASKSLVVIEVKGRLGGHTETYTDPVTGRAQDYGVLVFHNESTVLDYFARFDIPLAIPEFATNRANYDLSTGLEVNISAPSPEALGAGLQTYGAFLAQYPELNSGMFLPDPVPEDLTMPFGDFVVKYGIEAIVQTLYSTNQGTGDILSMPVLEQARVNGLGLVAQLAANGLISTAQRNNSELYGKAQVELLDADSLLLSSEVVNSVRHDDGVELVVETPDGNTGVPEGLFTYNYAPDTPYNLPAIPGIYLMQPTAIPGVKAIYYGADVSNATYPLSDDFIKGELVASIKRLQAANPDKFNATEPEFVVYTSHAPFYVQATSEDIKARIYDEMNALQGLKSTYWSGAAFRAHDSSALWQLNKEVVLPMLTKGL
ncbi:hypothetical protein AA0118_g8813 [Alternaria tenuissima]|nr:hypothetical protein AA0118_g8813 [Alternaria tenuissima]